MAIRVEHGPNLGAVGKVAYQTGQLEYRNKRRAELEKLAMQQAEMRQKARMQQQQIASSLQGQKMSQMGAMQRLQMGQQFGQINDEQAFQRQLQINENAREHGINLSKQHGQNTIDATKLSHGLATKRDLNQIRWKQSVSDAENVLNNAGKQEQLSMFQRRVALESDDRIPPDQLQARLDELDAEILALSDNPLYRIGREKEPGFSEEYGIAEDGTNYTHIRTRDSNGEWGYEPNLVKRTQITDDQGQEQWVEDKINQSDWQHNNVKISRRDGQMIITQADPYSNKLVTRVVNDPNSPLEQDAADALKAREDKAIKFDIDEMNKFRTARDAANANGTVPPDLAEWQQEFPNPYRDAPAPIAPVPNPNVDEFLQQEQQQRIDEQPPGAPSAPVAPVAPVAPDEFAAGGGILGSISRAINPFDGNSGNAPPVADSQPAMGRPDNPWPPEQQHLAKAGDTLIPAPGVPPMVKQF
tara:strand:+ start:50 stop:1462 length:1413 start_codon:yes stop_codon:yes gene_type:complete